MKRINLIFLFVVIECFSGIKSYAYDAVIDGIYYNFSGTNATVTFKEQKNSYPYYYSDYSENIVIPESVTYQGTTYSVTSIGNNAFYYCSGLTSVTIPNSVTYIGRSAFESCKDLTSVTIPNSVTSIDRGAFWQCSNLTKVIIPDLKGWCEHSITYGELDSNPLSIAGHIFSDENTEITNLVIPDGTTSIGDNAFNDCSSLTSVTIPNSVTSIGSSAFSGCSGLISVTIPNSVTSIGSSAFYNCSGLTSVTFHCSEIGSWFSGLSIQEIIIGDEVTSIGSSAFYNCSGLTSVTIPNSVTSIGEYAFSGCI